MIKKVGNTPVNPSEESSSPSEESSSPKESKLFEGRRYSSDQPSQKITFTVSHSGQDTKNTKIQSLNASVSIITEEEKEQYIQQIICEPSKFQSIPASLQKERAFLLKALAQQGLLLEFLSEECKDDVELVDKAVENNGLALGYASSALQNKKETVLKAVKNTGAALLLTSKDLQNDKEVVRQALLNPGQSYLAVGAEALEDREIALLVVRVQGYQLGFLCEKFKKDKEIVLAAVSNYGQALLDAPLFQNDEEVVQAAVVKDPEALQWASKELQSSKKITIVAGGIVGLTERLGKLDRQDQQSMLDELEKLQPAFAKELFNVLKMRANLESKNTLQNIHFNF